ncbi:MAG: hypothetical protein K0S39_2889 [Paenibacillus sp.]|jgi:hypothetical protein|nr:hypothetical protein [Paenibacillus sp.]
MGNETGMSVIPQLLKNTNKGAIKEYLFLYGSLVSHDTCNPFAG